MKWIVRLAFLIIGNAVALYIADRYVPGFSISPATIQALLATGAVLTVLNGLIRPILKLLLTPLIVITLGLASFAVNAVVLKFLDIISEPIMINGLLPLIYGTLIVTVVNTVFNVVTKSK